MTAEELSSYIDSSLLRPEATVREIEGLVRDAHRYCFASVCIPPCHVRLAARALGESPVRVGTVIGFPFGYQSMDVKINEALDAVENGADEIDMVMNISLFKSGQLDMVKDEISAVSSILPGIAIKVIIETCYLNDQEKVAACELVIRGKADYIKTSTGFGPAGATVEDIRLLAHKASGRIKVKAAGGIRNLDDALRMIEAGASRVGTSAGVKIVEEFKRGVR